MQSRGQTSYNNSPDSSVFSNLRYPIHASVHEAREIASNTNVANQRCSDKTPPLDPTPTQGEPVQPRKHCSFQRSQSRNPSRASNIRRRNSYKRGLRSLSRCGERNRSKKTRLNRRLFRSFKQWYLKFAIRSRGKAPETRRRHRRQSNTDKWKQLNRMERKRLFLQFKNRDKRIAEPTQLAYNRPIKAATLDVRGLVGENALTKESILVDIMKTQGYDIMRLQETNVNTSCIRDVNKFTFYYSSDVKQKDIKKKEEQSSRCKGKR